MRRKIMSNFIKVFVFLAVSGIKVASYLTMVFYALFLIFITYNYLTIKRLFEIEMVGDLESFANQKIIGFAISAIVAILFTVLQFKLQKIWGKDSKYIKNYNREEF